jgi:hypothetical protein
LVGIGTNGAPVVDFPDNPAGTPVPSMATARYDGIAIGEAVALMFIDGDRTRPLVVGVITQPAEAMSERLTFAAAREIVLKCGRASIVLTQAGKVLLRGSYMSLRSSGMQRITGGSVQIN